MQVLANNHDSNVNIQCNAGFYMMVAKPLITAFSQGAVCQYPPVQVMCTEVHTNTDKAGSNDFSRLTFNLKGSDQSILGAVSVHFCHSYYAR